ncbi:MAG: adenosylcobinamide-GDP ribazoletransferase [Rhodobacteraceae bacterium]|nr:adenosylcobinamide-GDP ribazoletransferase [Paracoccaceae bacterium]
MNAAASHVRTRLAEVQVAVMLLTRLPAGRIAGQAPAIGQTIWAWPLVGLLVGGISASIFLLAIWFDLPRAFAAVLALAAGIATTGGLHEDGLADLADGFGGGRNRDEKLGIMRDSRIGSYGVLALILALAARGTAISASPEACAAIVGLAAASRGFLPAAILAMPTARPDGLGRTATGGSAAPVVLSLTIGFVCLLPLGLGPAIVAMIVMAVAVTALGVIAHRQIGGQTGDVLGAMQQTAEIAGWACLLACL